MTLPTRAKDGGIDVEKVKIVQNTIFIGEWFLSTDAFIRLISAHTRERCAKLAHECWENGIPAQEIAQRIRRMED